MNIKEQSTVRFREERQGDWVRLEAILDYVEVRSVKALDDDELQALPVLYRATLSSLSVARATSLDRSLIEYLEALSLRAYFFMYGSRTSLRRRVVQFLAHDWPGAMRELWPETLVAILITIVGAVVGYMLVDGDNSWFSAIIDPGLAGGRGPEASAAELREMLYSGGEQGFLGGFAAFLFTHNSEVAIMCFALGFAFCVPTVLLLAYNGCMLGAFLQIYIEKGLGFQMGGWLFIHGTTEIFAICLAAAAGMRIGTRVAFPGDLSRLVAGAKAGRTAANAMVGVVIMLLVAGLLEGVGRQTVNNDLARYAIGASALALWIVFYYGSRGRSPSRG